MDSAANDSASAQHPSLPFATDELLPLVYGELRRIAAHRMAQESPGLTLQATALVHEAWLRLDREQQAWQNRAHFFAAAGEAMRRILIEQARRRLTGKRGGGAVHDPVTDSMIQTSLPDEEMLAVHEALSALATEDEAAANLVKLRFFIGMTMGEAAEAMDIPLRSAERLWTWARARLRLLVSESQAGN